MIPSPLPYKLQESSDLQDGSLVDIPKFCRRNYHSTKCRDFYEGLTLEKGISVCPYGFCAQRCSFGEDKDVIFSCLNLEKLSDRRLLRKYLKDDDFSPRLSKDRYEKIKYYFSTVLEKGVDDVRVAQISETVNTEKEALSNAMHELRNFSNQLTSRADKLTIACQGLIQNTHLINEVRRSIQNSNQNEATNRLDEVSEVIQSCTIKMDDLVSTVYALSNFISIRLDTYKMEVDSYQVENTAHFDVNIHKKVVKAIRCLRDRALEKHVEVDLKGRSYASFYASQGLEIAIFIIIDNAIKYAPESSIVSVRLKESDGTLCLQVKNWGLVPPLEEIPRLTTRGYRSSVIQANPNYKGRGIGLFLVSQLCKAHGVRLEISLGESKELFNGDSTKYGEFIVNLYFSPIKGTESSKE